MRRHRNRWSKAKARPAISSWYSRAPFFIQCLLMGLRATATAIMGTVITEWGCRIYFSTMSHSQRMTQVVYLISSTGRNRCCISISNNKLRLNRPSHLCTIRAHQLPVVYILFHQTQIRRYKWAPCSINRKCNTVKVETEGIAIFQLETWAVLAISLLRVTCMITSILDHA